MTDDLNDHARSGAPDREPRHDDPKILIKIDRDSFKVDAERMTGAQLRVLPQPPIGPDRDLFQVVPGGSDKKISDTDIVQLKNGIRFFTAPTQINPGRG